MARFRYGEEFWFVSGFFFIRSVVSEVKVNLSKIAFCFRLLLVELIIFGSRIILQKPYSMQLRCGVNQWVFFF